MTNAFDVGELIRLAQEELNSRNTGQEFMLSDVYNMSRQAYEKYPEDSVIKQFAFVIERLSEKHGPYATINQKEMSEIYNNFVRLSSNSRFKDVMGKLVFGSAPNVQSNIDDFISANRTESDALNIESSEYFDKELNSQLSNAFSGFVVAEKIVDEKLSKKGCEYVAEELKSMGFDSNVEFVGGDKTALVYSADFNTSGGTVSVALPIEISSGKLLFPSVFVADDSFERLDANKLNYFIDKKAFNRDFSTPNPKAILKAISALAESSRGGNFEKVAEPYYGSDEFYTSHGNRHSNECKEYMEIEQEKIEMPKELAHLASDFEDNILESASIFGRSAVVAGRNVVVAELSNAGFKNAQVKFASESNDSAIYVAKLNTPKGAVEIEIPVEMKEVAEDKYKPLLPNCFACDGVVEDLTPSKLQRFILRHSPSSGQVVCSDSHSFLTLPELKDEILKHAGNNDYVSCEMILGTIQERFPEEDYKNTVADYHYALRMKNKYESTPARKCSREICAGRGSIQSRCGHYLVAMDKVVVGEDGVCRLKTSIERERLNPVKDGGAEISTSKIILT